jgi:hypothetical protein
MFLREILFLWAGAVWGVDGQSMGGEREVLLTIMRGADGGLPQGSGFRVQA